MRARDARRAATLIAALGATLAGGAASAAAAGFTSFNLAGTPPQPAGTVCPGSKLCTNGAAEPAIRATPDGQFFASSENGLGAGTLAWRSSDGGRHYSSLLSPNDLSVGGSGTGEEAGLEPGGGDTDVAIAGARNAGGFYNVYVASLTLANIDVSTSKDNGATWALNPATALPIDDREWIAATGASGVCISYLSAPGILLPQAGLHVQCSSDAGATFPQLADAYDTSAVGTGARSSSRSGNLAFDPVHGNYLYAIFAYQSTADAVNPNPTGLHNVGIAVSSDGGKTFHDYNIYTDPDVTKSFDNNFPNVAVDRAGNVYAVYSDGYRVYMNVSRDHGKTWSARRQISGSGATSLFPWTTAGAAGKIDVVWYQTSYEDPSTPPDDYPTTARWFVHFAQNLAAASSGSRFTQSTASPVVHRGGVCRGGVACTGDNTKNRDLYDDFGIAASPITGLASIVYSDDQYTSSATLPHASGCTTAESNDAACDHTQVATQTSGPGIF